MLAPIYVAHSAMKKLPFLPQNLDEKPIRKISFLIMYACWEGERVGGEGSEKSTRKTHKTIKCKLVDSIIDFKSNALS